MQLELNDREQQTLSDALKSFLFELRTEISHTDLRAYRERLKDQDQLLRQILSRVDQTRGDAEDVHGASHGA